MSLQRYPLMLLIFSITSIPLLCSGLECACTNDCAEGQSTCTAPEGGICFAQLFSDISGMNWHYREGCLDDLNSVICTYPNSTTHTNICCNKDFCNRKAIPPNELSCHCHNNNDCVDGDRCILDSPEQWCYTLHTRLGSTITRIRGCAKTCKEKHTDRKLRICCQGDRCNNETHLTEWPSPTTATPPTTTDSDILSPELKPTNPSSRKPPQLICYCSDCTDGNECLADVACASRVINSNTRAWCINDEKTCNNSSFQLNCCHTDRCNGPVRPAPEVPPCDDEDTEVSGGCDFTTGASPTSSSTTTATTTATTTTSTSSTAAVSSRTMPTQEIVQNDAAQDNDSDLMMMFYLFTTLLIVCLVAIFVVILVCIATVCHYRSMAYKTVLSSTTILESAMKEKGYQLRNTSPV